MIEQPTFSVDCFDRDGDIFQRGIFLHWGETRVRIADDVDGIDDFIKHLEKVKQEIVENY